MTSDVLKCFHYHYHVCIKLFCLRCSQALCVDCSCLGGMCNQESGIWLSTIFFWNGNDFLKVFVKTYFMQSKRVLFFKCWFWFCFQPWILSAALIVISGLPSTHNAFMANVTSGAPPIRHVAVPNIQVGFQERKTNHSKNMKKVHSNIILD